MLDPQIRAFLDDGDYATIEDWARDSDYHEINGQWYNDEGYGVDLIGCIEGAMEASNFDFD